MTDQTLYQDAFYRVILHQPLRHPTTIVAFQARQVGAHPVRAGDFGASFLPSGIYLSDLPANFVSVLVSRNCWYLDPVLHDALSALRAAIAGTRVVTYGSSMGGYAAVNLSAVLGAGLFLAISPLSTIFDPYALSINDRRFPEDRRLLSPDQDRIGRGEVLDQPGLVFFDSHNPLDAAHAGRIAALSRADLVDVPHGGHPCGRVLNQIYPLRQILTEAAAGHPPVQAIRRQILALAPDLPEALAASLDTLPQFFQLCRQDISELRSEAFLNAAELLRVPPAAGAGATARRLRDIADLAGFIQHPMAAWGQESQRRVQALTALCRAYDAAGRNDLARDLARRALPPAQVQRLYGPA